MQLSKLLNLPPDAVENIRKMYDIDKPERLKETLDLMEDWVQKQTHFVKRDFSREYLEKTVISCKGSVERAKKQLDTLCTMKTCLPKFFVRTNVRDQLQYITEWAWLVPLPKVCDLDNDYYRAIVVRVNLKDIQEPKLMEYFQYVFITCEYIKKYDYVNGFIAVYDLRSINIMDLVTKINSVELQQFMSILITAYGARLRNIYFISESKTIELLMKLLKQLLSQKISSRVHVIPNLEELQKCIPKEILPKDYGGNERPTDVLIKEWVEVLSTEEHVEYMRMMNRAGTDESRRPAAQFNQDCMGMPGSFRNLTVD